MVAIWTLPDPTACSSLALQVAVSSGHAKIVKLLLGEFQTYANLTKSLILPNVTSFPFGSPIGLTLGSMDTQILPSLLELTD